MDETFDVQSELKCFEENEIVQAARHFIEDELSKLYLAPKSFREACNVARELGYSDEELETFRNDYDRGEYDIAVITADKKKFLVAVVKEIGINDIADMFFFDSKHLALILENAPFLFWNNEGRSPQVYLNKEKQQFYENQAIEYSLDILRGIAPIDSGRANFFYINSKPDCLSPKAFSLPWILGHGRDNDKHVVVNERVKTPENLKLLQKHQCGELRLFSINILQQYAIMRHNLLQSLFAEIQFKDSTAGALLNIGTNGNTQPLPKPKPVTQPPASNQQYRTLDLPPMPKELEGVLKDPKKRGKGKRLNAEEDAIARDFFPKIAQCLKTKDHVEVWKCLKTYYGCRQELHLDTVKKRM